MVRMLGHVLLTVVLLAWVTAGCRGDEQQVSGQPWVCTCQLAAGGQSAVAHVCALTASEAAKLAPPCIEQSGSSTVRFCDCLPDTTTFCELGDCTPE